MRPKLEDLLIEEKLLDEAALRRVRQLSREKGISLARAVVEDGAVSALVLADMLTRRTQLPRVELEREPVDDEAIREVPHQLADSRRLLPLQIDRDRATPTIRVAMADPLDIDAMEEIAIATGCEVEAVIAPVSDLKAAIDRHYRGIVTKMIPRAVSPREVPTSAQLDTLVDLLIERGVFERGDYERALEKRLRSSDGE